MIQYFATNRALDKLANVVSDRETRLKLSKGGYYFVDMDKYMRYYLATTDSGKMPKGAIVTNSASAVFDGFLADRRIGRIVVCIHGFNVELFEAYTWFRVLTDTMKHVPDLGDRIVTSPAELVAKPKSAPAGSLTAFIGFSWPSNGNVFSYASDQRESVGTAPAFASLLAHLKTTGKSLNLVCHSMGNYLACHAFAALINEVVVPSYAVEKPEIQALLKRAELKAGSENVERNGYFVDSYVMIAPDVERRHVTKCEVADLDDTDTVDTDYVGPFYSGLQHLVGKKVNVYSRFDSALNVSDLEKKPREAVLAAGDALSRWSFGLLEFLERNPDQRWEKRLGSAPAPINAAPGFVSVNATEIAGRKIDHSDHVDVTPLAQCIAEELGV
jgi:esterase/lipase superfamily enzyme